MQVRDGDHLIGIQFALQGPRATYHLWEVDFFGAVVENATVEQGEDNDRHHRPPRHEAHACRDLGVCVQPRHCSSLQSDEPATGATYHLGSRIGHHNV